MAHAHHGNARPLAITRYLQRALNDWLAANPGTLKKDLADRIGISGAHVTNITKNGRGVGADVEELCAKFLGMTVDELRRKGITCIIISHKLNEIEQIADIVPASKVPASNLIGLAGIENGEWGSILSGMPLVTKPKARHNAEDDYVFATMACAVPQFRVDYNGQMPVAHTTT